ncbi:RTA1-domain-containing protein [Lophium mytilinum]|uniref:RTA1-domain-containing protein n=1 Tax=Lophium mytilinum TaxID=390894 RepID=A0A6A6QB42_9PEZI|nr:RTA1-domain-containing protein [Lophium mytilinum]
MSTGNILLPRAKDFVYYHYDPSKAAAIIFLVLFTTSTLHHFYQMMRTRTWYFIPFFIGGVLETIGYVGRVINANETPNWTQTWFIVQYMGILLAPALFAASIYMILGRIVLLTDAETHSFVRLKWMTATFVSGDVLSFLVQALGSPALSIKHTSSQLTRRYLGGGMSASGSNASTGQTVLVIGLFIQIVFFSMFAINSWVFMLRLRKSPTTKSKRVPWMKFLATKVKMEASWTMRCFFTCLMRH